MTPEEALLRRLARSSGLRPAEVRRLVQLEVVAPAGESLQPAMLRRLRKIRRLRRDLGLSLDAVVIVVRLLDRIEELEGRQLRTRRVRVLDDLLD
jgi:MerR-like DNA binding protein